eukprot:6334836-Pyramimonas_sp.AAC.1
MVRCPGVGRTKVLLLASRFPVDRQFLSNSCAVGRSGRASRGLSRAFWGLPGASWDPIWSASDPH